MTRLAPDDYRVRLDAFEGPLDLLLFLIRRHEVELFDIPVAAITEQYLAFLGQLELEGTAIDVELAGEFLVMAATLVELKSKLIAHQHELERRRDGDDGGPADAGLAGEFDAIDPADPRADLVRQLLEYRRFRELADRLEHRRDAWHRRAPAGRAGIDDDRVREAMDAIDDEDLDELPITVLTEAFERIIGSVNMDRLGDHSVVSDDTPIELHAEDIVDQLRRAGGRAGSGAAADGQPSLPLRAVFAGRTRPEMVGLFLALLDLVRSRRVGFHQPQDEFGATAEILLSLRPDADRAGEDEGSSGEGAEPSHAEPDPPPAAVADPSPNGGTARAANKPDTAHPAGG